MEAGLNIGRQNKSEKDIENDVPFNSVAFPRVLPHTILRILLEYCREIKVTLLRVGEEEAVVIWVFSGRWISRHELRIQWDVQLRGCLFPYRILSYMLFKIAYWVPQMCSSIWILLLLAVNLGLKTEQMMIICPCWSTRWPLQSKFEVVFCRKADFMLHYFHFCLVCLMTNNFQLRCVRRSVLKVHSGLH